MEFFSSPDFVDITVVACWLIFGIYWIASAFFQKDVAEKPRLTVSGFLARFCFAAPFVILVRPEFLGLDMHLYARGIALSITSMAIAASGLSVCIWARASLASNWSQTLDLKRAHTLIRHGPYAYVRHPIYTGFLLLFLGSALASGALGGFIGFLILLIGVWLRIRQEEALLRKHFPAEYSQYAANTRALIPYIF